MSDMGCDTSISFEGPEKVLEVWFIHPSEYEDGGCGCPGSTPSPRYLLDVSREEWEEMLDLVNCQILSEISTANARAYLLSESSLFIYETQLVIKTCGTTTLLNCLHKMLQIASKYGLCKVDNVFYNRQAFFFPNKQIFPHQTFSDEAKWLDSFFLNGGAYTVGRVNNPNHYNFYNAECRMSRDDPAMKERDSTLEILMTKLDPTAMQNFFYQEGVTNKEIRERTGIADFFDNALIDDYMFQPYGYSLNALMDDGYFTIHITPQDHCSFVSFETNVYLADYTELIDKVLRCFRPQQFIVVQLSNNLASETTVNRGFEVEKLLAINENTVGVYKSQDDINLSFDHYSLRYNQCEVVGIKSDNEGKRRKEQGGTILKTDSPFFSPRDLSSAESATSLIL